MGQNKIKEMLTEYKTIAIVGLSRDPKKYSHKVGAYLKKHGFQMIPVNPFADEVLGEKSYRSLLDIPIEIQKTIQVVNIFRPKNDVPKIVDEVIKLKITFGKPNVVWMQLGIINKQAAKAAKDAGLIVVMDKCMMIEHKRFFEI